MIIGYRADDSYFSYAESFLNNTISLKRLNEALKLGNLGEQVVLKTKKAFNNIKFIKSIKVNKDEYYPLREKRNIEAREKFLKNKKGIVSINDIYLNDIMRGAGIDDTSL